MASVQDTIRSYTDRICKISEKKNKLLSKMSTTANQSLDFDDPTHYARPTSSAISASNSEGNSVSVTSDGGNNTSQYITPPRSPLLLPQRCPASEDPSKSQQHTLVQKTSVAEKCKFFLNRILILYFFKKNYLKIWNIQYFFKISFFTNILLNGM